MCCLESVPLRGENHFKPRPQNRALLHFRGENHFKLRPQNRALVPLRGENHFKPLPQNRALIPLRGENHFKPRPQNRALVPLRGENHFKPRPQNRALVPLRGSFQNFRRELSCFLYGTGVSPLFLFFLCFSGKCVLRATCCNGHLYLCKIEKIDFLKICQEEGFY